MLPSAFLVGEWGLYVNDLKELKIADVGTLQDVFLFEGGKVKTNSFFCENECTANVTAKKINVIVAFSRDVALHILDNKEENVIILYADSSATEKEGYNANLSFDFNYTLTHQMGMIVKVNAQEIDVATYNELDKALQASVIMNYVQGFSLPRFEGIGERFFTNEGYCFDAKFSYLEHVNEDDIKDLKTKGFDFTIEYENTAKGNI